MSRDLPAARPRQEESERESANLVQFLESYIALFNLLCRVTIGYNISYPLVGL